MQVGGELERERRRLSRRATQLIAEALSEQYPGVEFVVVDESGDELELAPGHLQAADEHDLEAVLNRRVRRARESG